MLTPDTVRRLLLDSAGEALCYSCLAFGCSVSLAVMRRVTEELLTSASFQRHDKCVSCRRTVPAICFAAKCVHCSCPVLPGEDALEIDGHIFHAACLRVLSSDEAIRLARKLIRRSRRLIEQARRRMREHRSRWNALRS